MTVGPPVVPTATACRISTAMSFTPTGPDNCIFGIILRVEKQWEQYAGLILGLRPANERHRYKVTLSLIGWVQT